MTMHQQSWIRTATLETIVTKQNQFCIIITITMMIIIIDYHLGKFKVI